MSLRTTLSLPLAVLLILAAVGCGEPANLPAPDADGNGATATTAADPANPAAPATVAKAVESVAIFDLAQIPDADLSENGWSAAEKDGEIAYRTAKTGARQTFKVPAWWKKGDLRPADGSYFILELKFKDTLSTPAEFWCHGAVGSYFGMTLMHRFGGANDGQWKTANIPISWDMVIRLKDELEKTQFGVKADGEVAIAGGPLRASTAADQVRFEAETRAWVALNQKASREANPLKTEPRNFGQDRELGSVVAFAWPAQVPLLANAQPKTEQIGATIRIRMCRNELEGGSFGIYANEATLKNVNYTVSELKNGETVLKADVIRRTAEYALVQAGGDKLKWFPQRLWPAYDAEVPAGQSQWFLFNIRTRRGESQPGVYKGSVEITCDQGKASLPIEVEVLNIDLPTMDEAGLVMGGCCVGMPPQQDLRFQAEYNQNCSNIWFAGAQPPMTKKGGKLQLDFTYFDDWMTNGRKSGMSHVVWFLGGDPYGFPDTVTLVRDLHRIDLKGDENMASRKAWLLRQKDAPEKLLPDTRELYKEWVRQVYAQMIKAKWPEVILTPFDEPAKWTQKARPEQLKGKLEGVIGTGPWIKPFFKDCCAAIHEAAPKMRIYGSIHHNRQQGATTNEGIVFLEDIDVFCTNAIHEDPQLGDKVRAGKKTFWQYSGCGGGGGPAPDKARYTFGFFFANFDSRGSLAWAYNWGPGLDTTGGGDNWEYAWQTPYGTVPAPFFEGMREAWDDRRIIEAYKKKFSRDQAKMAVLTKILADAAGSRTSGGRDTVSDFWAAIDDVAKIDGWRETLLDALAGEK